MSLKIFKALLGIILVLTILKWFSKVGVVISLIAVFALVIGRVRYEKCH